VHDGSGYPISKVKIMGDRKPKKNSSGNADAHKSKQPKPSVGLEPIKAPDAKKKK
jgi:hypothetical protein